MELTRKKFKWTRKWTMYNIDETSHGFTVWWSNVYFDRLGIIQWDSVVGALLGLRAYQTVNKELEFIFLSCKKIREM